MQERPPRHRREVPPCTQRLQDAGAEMWTCRQNGKINNNHKNKAAAVAAVVAAVHLKDAAEYQLIFFFASSSSNLLALPPCYNMKEMLAWGTGKQKAELSCLIYRCASMLRHHIRRSISLSLLLPLLFQIFSISCYDATVSPSPCPPFLFCSVGYSFCLGALTPQEKSIQSRKASRPMATYRLVYGSASSASFSLG